MARTRTENLILFRILPSDKAAFLTVPFHTWFFSLKAESHFAVSIETHSYYGKNITKSRHLAIKISLSGCQKLWPYRALTTTSPKVGATWAFSKSHQSYSYNTSNGAKQIKHLQSHPLRSLWASLTPSNIILSPWCLGIKDNEQKPATKPK